MGMRKITYQAFVHTLTDADNSKLFLKYHAQFIEKCCPPELFEDDTFFSFCMRTAISIKEISTKDIPADPMPTKQSSKDLPELTKRDLLHLAFLGFLAIPEKEMDRENMDYSTVRLPTIHAA